jgi:hypothetical protein
MNERARTEALVVYGQGFFRLDLRATGIGSTRTVTVCKPLLR